MPVKSTANHKGHKEHKEELTDNSLDAVLQYRDLEIDK
jgi:hypothetical protein